MDMVAREAVGAFADELQRDWPRAVRAFWRTTTPAPPALDESEALRVHGHAHPGDVVARFRGLWSTAASHSSISSSRVPVGRSRQTTEGHTRRQDDETGETPSWHGGFPYPSDEVAAETFVPDGAMAVGAWHLP